MKNTVSLQHSDLILVPTDFSEVCENALVHGMELAKILHYRVCLLHVVTNEKNNRLFSKKTMAYGLLKQLNALKTKYETKYPVMIDVLVKNGNLLQVIEQVATEQVAGLLILGTHGKKGFQNLFGSHALKIVIDAPCPVISIRRTPFAQGYCNITVPVNGEFDIRQSFTYLELLHKLFHARINLFFSSTGNGREKSGRAETMLGNVTDFLKNHNIQYSVRVAENGIAYTSQLIAFAAEMNSDLIVIMTFPETESPDFSFLQWNEQLMFNEKHIPVMTVDPQGPDIVLSDTGN